MWALGAWLLGCVAVWRMAPAILDAMLAPLPAPAVYLGPADGFMLYCKIAMLGGAVLASPVIAWQAVGFIRPALKAREQRALGAVLAGGVVCFAAGAWFAWRFLLPSTTGFLLSFASERLRPQIVADGYVNYVLLLALGCGASFELPVATAILARLGLIAPRTLARQWRTAIFGCFVLAAVVTPSPDAFTMLMVALPLVALYGMGILTAMAAAR